MNSLSHDKLASLAFSADQAATLRAVGECRGRQSLYYQQAPEVLKRLRDVAVIESAESSNRMEGVIVSPGRLEPLMLRKTDPRNRSEQELAGYRDALALIHGNAQDMPFTPNVVLQLHAALSRYMANPGGKWKSTNNDIIERHPDGATRIRFKPTPSHLVQMQVDELASRYNTLSGTNGLDPLVLVPLTVFDFLCIHPFTDGNGRISRLLTLMLLYQHDYQVGRYISLERVIEESKDTYYESLEASSQGWHEGQHDVMHWLNYFWGVLLRAYREFEDRVGEVREGRGAKTEQVRLAVLAKKAPFAISDIEVDCPGVSRDMVRHVLRQLKTEGQIRLIGRGRGAKWELMEQSGAGQ